MRNAYIPLNNINEWKDFLAAKKHWKPGHSAWALAHSWLAAGGFPPELQKMFKASDFPAFQKLEILLAIPEYKVYLPPHPGHASQNDLFVLAKADDGSLISITVEGKLDESFGPRLREWNKGHSSGKDERWNYLKQRLGLTQEPPPNMRYQLFHRLASAIIMAEKFNAKYACMIIHSFSKKRSGFADFSAFIMLFGAGAEVGRLVHLTNLKGISVYTGWADGDPKFLK